MAAMAEARPPATQEEAFDDVEMRFLDHLPPSETEAGVVERLFFQLQQAHWFYEDFFVDDLDHIPHMRFRAFTEAMFARCRILDDVRDSHDMYRERFKEYASRIPSIGSMILNKKMTQILLVQPFGGKSWTCPKGKINEGESDFECAIREVDEETSVNIRPYASKDDFVAIYNGDQLVKLFIARGVPMTVETAPRTRKEVGAIEWHPVAAIPKRRGIKGASKYWTVLPFIGQLRKWIRSHGGGKALAKAEREEREAAAARGDAKTPGRAAGGRGGGGSGRGGGGRGGGGHRTGEEDETFGTGASASGGWCVEEMFRTNAEMLGVNFTYDGNPQTFGDAAQAGAAAAGSGGGLAPASVKAKRRARREAAARAADEVVGSSRGSGRSGRGRRGKAASGGGGKRKRSADAADAPLDETFGPGADTGGWGPEAMFRRNAEMLGVSFTYDGNPQTFGDAAQGRIKLTPAKPGAPAGASPEPSPSGAAASASAASAPATPTAPPLPTAARELAAFEPDLAAVMAAFHAAGEPSG